MSVPEGVHPELVEGSPVKKRQMEWESPWGVGFPGWHIECSAMSVKYLGQPFDIHCGGIDHIAVHHENEIAQSEAASGKPLANYWMHNEFLTIDGRRMGKSEGNAYTLDDVVAKGFDPLALRYFYLGAHYRTKVNFTWDALKGAQSALDNLRTMARRLSVDWGEAKQVVAIEEEFIAALEDDLNTPKALAVLWDVFKHDLSDAEKCGAILVMDKVLGLNLSEVIGIKIEIPEAIRHLADERLLARQSKDWAKSDELRAEIEAAGWSVKDGPNDTYEILPR